MIDCVQYLLNKYRSYEVYNYKIVVFFIIHDITRPFTTLVPVKFQFKFEHNTTTFNDSLIAAKATVLWGLGYNI